VKLVGFSGCFGTISYSLRLSRYDIVPTEEEIFVIFRLFWCFVGTPRYDIVPVGLSRVRYRTHEEHLKHNLGPTRGVPLGKGLI
jgi:hypothetical protein